MVEWGNGERTLGDDQRLEPPLLGRALQDLRLDRVGAEEPEDEDGLCLPNAVRAVLCLEISLRVLSRRS